MKNMSKDGGFYWVFTPYHPRFWAAGQIVGYTSVRRCPRADSGGKIEAGLIARCWPPEQAAGARTGDRGQEQPFWSMSSEQFELSYEELVRLPFSRKLALLGPRRSGRRPWSLFSPWGVLAALVASRPVSCSWPVAGTSGEIGQNMTPCCGSSGMAEMVGLPNVMRLTRHRNRSGRT